jgi:hypothetical protein
MPLWQPDWGSSMRHLSGRQLAVLFGVVALVVIVGVLILVLA